MRINRGKTSGFKKGGRLYAVLEEDPAPAGRTARAGTEHPASDRSEQRRRRPDPGSSSSQAAAPDPGEPSLPLVVEFQKIELSRLLRDNARLNRRLDNFMDELRHLREVQQREQVLRQQDQALWQKTQSMIERLTAPPVPAPAKFAMPPSAPPVHAPPVHGPLAPDPPAPGPLEPDPPAPDLARSRPIDPGAGGAGAPPESPPTDPAYAYEMDATLSPPPSAPPPSAPPPDPGPEPLSGPADSTGDSRLGAHHDTVDLADMLKEIGAALRRLDPDSVDALAAAPPDPARTEPAPSPGQGARRTPGNLAGPPADPPPGQPPYPGRRPPLPPLGSPPPVDSPADDEAGLLEILSRMGPSAEERRTAGRLMQRLLKGHRQRRPKEPGDDTGG